LVRIATLACLVLAAYAPAAAAAGRAGTARALAKQMRWAGGSAGALAVDLDSGRTLYSLRARTQRMPASATCWARLFASSVSKFGSPLPRR
jgi:D-alanyl-D-alanine carboxypeptidase